MLPCCALGALFFIQFMAFTRWFKKTILRKPLEENESDYWVPERVSIRNRIKGLFKDHRRLKIAGIALTVEIAMFVVVYALGGFDFKEIPDLIKHLRHFVSEML